MGQCLNPEEECFIYETSLRKETVSYSLISKNYYFSRDYSLKAPKGPTEDVLDNFQTAAPVTCKPLQNF